MAGLHEVAVELRSRELAAAMADLDQHVTDLVRITACDLLGWAYRIAEKSGQPVPRRKQIEQVAPDHRSGLHRFWGATWARHRLTHGDAELLGLAMSNEIDQSFDSPDILCDDKEVTFNGELAQDRTLRFAEVPDGVPGDPRPELQSFYNQCVAGRRVAVIAGLMAGQRTMAGR